MLAVVAEGGCVIWRLVLVESMTFGSVTQRLARLLLDASKAADAFDLRCDLHQELASRLGTVRKWFPATWVDSGRRA